MVVELTLQNRFFQEGDPNGWTLEIIQRLKSMNNKTSCFVGYWFDSILEGYIAIVFLTLPSKKGVL